MVRVADRRFTRPRDRSTPIARIAVAVAVAVVLSQAISLAVRASRGESDIGVFHRTTVALADGAGAELYRERDASGWPRAITPAGFALLYPFGWMSSTTAGVVWGLSNLFALAVAAVVLGRFLDGLERKRQVYRAAFPWAVAILLLLSSAAVQVGQLTAVFTVCWILFLHAAACGRRGRAGLWLAIPACVKLYPALLSAAPATRDLRRSAPTIASVVAAFLILSTVIPSVVLGPPRALDLTISFVQDALPARLTASRRLAADSLTDQGLDAVLLRYLSHDPEFHSRFPWLPHVRLERVTAVAAADVLRVVMIVTTFAVGVHWRRRVRGAPAYALMMLAALWSATLYATLPGAKARYAAYAFPAFLPLLGGTVGYQVRGERRSALWARTRIVLYLLALMQALPTPLLAAGIGWLAALALWGETLGSLITEKGPTEALARQGAGAGQSTEENGR